MLSGFDCGDHSGIAGAFAFVILTAPNDKALNDFKGTKVFMAGEYERRHT